MIKNNKKLWIHDAFLVGLILKGLNAVAEIIGGLGLYFLNNNKLLQIVLQLTHEELIEDPRDKVAQFLIQSAQNLSLGGRNFAIIYLLSHGIIKLALVWALLKKKLFAYPLALAVFTLFLVYQLYRFAFTHSIWLIILSVLDIIIIVLTWLEYKRIKSSIITQSPK